MSIEELHRRFLECTGACSDTRQLLDGGMFFALKGPHFNANAFAAEALEKGCHYAVVDDPTVAINDRFIAVPDVLRAIQDLARHHRRQFAIPLIAITGTNGKTTTKELVHAVLNADRPTLATRGNLNNHIGVPLTLLTLRTEHKIAVVEMGANKVGDIAELCAMAEPTHGLVTNIGVAHLEGFGSAEAIVTAKSELYEHLRRNSGHAFVHADDPLLMSKSEGIERTTYGTMKAAGWRGALLPNGAFLQLRWEHAGERSTEVSTRLIGAYNLPNALAAVCIGGAFGVPSSSMAAALSSFDPGNNRSQFIDTGRNQVIMDAYNANPTSMRAALENFAAMRSDLPKLAILGDMLELGQAAQAEHGAIIDLLDRLGLDAWLIGPEFVRTAGRDRFQRFANVQETIGQWGASPRKKNLLLVKGSRGMELELLLPAL